MQAQEVEGRGKGDMQAGTKLRGEGKGQPTTHQPERDPRWSMQELAVCLLPEVSVEKKINLLPPAKSRHECFRAC